MSTSISIRNPSPSLGSGTWDEGKVIWVQEYFLFSIRIWSPKGGFQEVSTSWELHCEVSHPWEGGNVAFLTIQVFPLAGREGSRGSSPLEQPQATAGNQTDTHNCSFLPNSSNRESWMSHLPQIQHGVKKGEAMEVQKMWEMHLSQDRTA